MKHPKFIQISSSSYVNIEGISYTRLYGLTEEGKVYRFTTDLKWTPLTKEDE